MNTIVCLLVLGAAVALVEGNRCINGTMLNCQLKCPVTQRIACEHGVCTCGQICINVNDCPACEDFLIPGLEQRMIPQDKHCLDNACICDPHPHDNYHHEHHGNHGNQGN